MSGYLEYSDEEIYELLRQARAQQEAGAATEEATPEPASKPSQKAENGIRPDLSVDEILKKMQNEIGSDKAAPVANTP